MQKIGIKGIKDKISTKEFEIAKQKKVLEHVYQ